MPLPVEDVGTQRMQETMDAASTNADQDQPLQNRRPVLIIPYIKGIGEKLQKIAKDTDCDTWWMYRGRASDRFLQFKGKTHLSKATNMVYCTECTCGLKYIGESFRNLKVRSNEHLHNSSRSTLTAHLLQYQNGTGHKADLEKTTILAQEGNTRKRKLMESMCIKYKEVHLCNAGVSLEMPGSWDVCIPALKEQLLQLDSDR